MRHKIDPFEACSSVTSSTSTVWYNHLLHELHPEGVIPKGAPDPSVSRSPPIPRHPQPLASTHPLSLWICLFRRIL